MRIKRKGKMHIAGGRQNQERKKNQCKKIKKIREKKKGKRRE